MTHRIRSPHRRTLQDADRREPDRRHRPWTHRRWVRALPYTLALLCAIGTGGVRAQADEKLYVSDELNITLRSGPGEQFQVLRTLSTGTALVPSERSGTWVRVQLEDGQRGWVLSRYLEAEEPARTRLPTVEAALTAAEQRIGDLEKELTTLRGERAELEALRVRAAELEATNARLQRSSGALQMAVGAGIALLGVLIGAIWSRTRASRGLSMSHRKLKI